LFSIVSKAAENRNTPSNKLVQKYQPVRRSVTSINPMLDFSMDENEPETDVSSIYAEKEDVNESNPLLDDSSTVRSTEVTINVEKVIANNQSGKSAVADKIMSKYRRKSSLIRSHSTPTDNIPSAHLESSNEEKQPPLINTLNTSTTTSNAIPVIAKEEVTIPPPISIATTTPATTTTILPPPVGMSDTVPSPMTVDSRSSTPQLISPVTVPASSTSIQATIIQEEEKQPEPKRSSSFFGFISRTLSRSTSSSNVVPPKPASTVATTASPSTTLPAAVTPIIVSPPTIPPTITTPTTATVPVNPTTAVVASITAVVDNTKSSGISTDISIVSANFNKDIYSNTQ
jgi:hypothetical protein